MTIDMATSRQMQLGPPLRRLIIVFVLAATLAMLRPATVDAAVGLTGNSSTYLQSREEADKTKILGAYEYLNFSVQDTENQSVTFRLGGWLRHDLKAKEFGKRSNSDLQFGYLSYRSGKSNGIVNLGRVMVSEGVAAERVDGVYAKTDLAHNFGVSAFGGIPVETEDNFPGNNMIYGGRLSHEVPGLYRIGISALKEEKNSADFRKEEGVDLWLRPVNKVELIGNSKYNSITSDWANHTYYLVLGPFDVLRLNTEASWINYGDYFSGATLSAFSFNPGIINPDEKVHILGEEVTLDAIKNVSLSANYKTYDYDIAGKAKYYGGTIRYALNNFGGLGYSVHKMDGDTDRLKYMEYRAYGYGKQGKADLTIDVVDVQYKASINGVKYSLAASIGAGYELTESLKVGADAEYSRNPDFRKDFRTFFKLIYSFDTASGRREGV